MTTYHRSATVAIVDPRLRLVKDALLGLSLMIVGVIVIAWVAAPLPLGALLGLLWAFVAVGLFRRFRKERS